MKIETWDQLEWMDISDPRVVRGFFEFVRDEHDRMDKRAARSSSAAAPAPRPRTVQKPPPATRRARPSRSKKAKPVVAPTT